MALAAKMQAEEGKGADVLRGGQKRAGLQGNHAKPSSRLCAPRPPQVPNVDGLIEEGKKAPKKNWDITLHSVWGPGEVTRLQPEVYTPAGGARERCRRAGRLGVAACCVRQLAKGRVVWQMHVQSCSRRGPSFSLTCRRARLLHPCAQVAGGQGGQGAQEAGGAGAGGGGGG